MRAKYKVALFMIVAMALSFSTAAFAAIDGVVVSVDKNQKKMEIRTADNGIQWVHYADSTAWPSAVREPAALQGKRVLITLNRGESMAERVEDATGLPRLGYPHEVTTPNLSGASGITSTESVGSGDSSPAGSVQY